MWQAGRTLPRPALGVSWCLKKYKFEFKYKTILITGIFKSEKVMGNFNV